MRHVICAVAVSAILAGCDYNITGADRCSDAGPTGQLEVVVRPAPGFVGFGAVVFVGDTMPLVAEVRPVTGWYTDIWGSGGCAPRYGDALAATIQWSSADSRIASVSATGVVRGVAEGTVRIAAHAQEHGMDGGLDVAVWVRSGS
jgi:hypothetical protein